MYKLALAFVPLFCLVASPAGAAGNSPDKWIVTQLSGDARVVHPGAQPASLKVNNLLTPGDTLLTGPNGRATLVHGADYIVLAPRSELRLPTAPQPTGFTRVVQTLGTLLFKVKHTGIPHFTVDTPMLAAVVKGTTFTVVVDGDRSAVQVIEGKVEVTALDGGMNRMVEGGRTIFVNRNNPRMLFDADKPAPARSAPSPTTVTVSATENSPVAAISELTAGLVRVEASAPQSTAVATASLPVQVERTPVATATAESTTARTPVVTATTSVVSTVTAAPAVVSGTATVPTTTPVVVSVTAPVPTTTTPVVVASVSTPLVSIGSNSGPSGNSGPGSLNSGPGSLNSGPGSLNSGTSTPTVTVAPISTPTVAIAPIATPTVTVPSVTTPTVTVPTVTVAAISTPTVTVPTITTPTVTVPAITTPVVTVPAITLPPLILKL